VREERCCGNCRQYLRWRRRSGSVDKFEVHEDDGQLISDVDSFVALESPMTFSPFFERSITFTFGFGE